MGPPSTSHFHVLADTPAGLQPINPLKQEVPSAAKYLIDLDKKDPAAAAEQSAEANVNSLNNVGLKMDQ